VLKIKVYMSKNIVIVGAGVANVNAATKLVDNNLMVKSLLLIWEKTHTKENIVR
jgi:NADH dehydrogenase FAD-containing subunit